MSVNKSPLLIFKVHLCHKIVSLHVLNWPDLSKQQLLLDVFYINTLKPTFCKPNNYRLTPTNALLIFAEKENSTKMTILAKTQSTCHLINLLAVSVHQVGIIKGILWDFFILILEQIIVLNKYYTYYSKPIPKISHENVCKMRYK